MRARGLGSALVAAGLTVLLVGCGSPRPGTTTYLNSEDVPYDLLATARPTTEPTAEQAPQRVWFVQQNRLAPVAPSTEPSGSGTQQANELLADLLDGPSENQYNQGYSSSLTGVTAQVRSVNSGVARVEVHERRDGGNPANNSAPLATGQIVLTVVSVAGIESVTFDDGDMPVEVPLPGGALTGRAVGESDYRSLIAE